MMPLNVVKCHCCRDDIYELASGVSYDVQVENLCLSAAVLRFLGMRVSRNSLSSYFWPCR